MSSPSVGILGLGAYLPPEKRLNSYWSAKTVAGWAKPPRDASKAAPPPPATEGEAASVREMTKFMADPFQGFTERRVMSKGMKSSDMEIEAARDAIARSGVKPEEIDVLMGFSFVPDLLAAPNACALHRELGLRRDVLSMSVDTVCNAFQTQLELATALIRSGQAKKVLMFQSSALSLLTPDDAPFAPTFGDGATAQVVGEVREGHGVLASAHMTDASLYGCVPAGVPGKRWHDDGKVVIHVADGRVSRRMLQTLADQAKEVIGRALATAKIMPEAVDYLATHQATGWLRPVVQDYCHLTNARAVDTFSYTASMSAANIPFVLTCGEREGQLRDGDVVVTFGGGGGVTVGAFVLKWGR